MTNPGRKADRPHIGGAWRQGSLSCAECEDGFESVARRLECDEDKERFEKTLRKLVKHPLEPEGKK